MTHQSIVDDVSVTELGTEDYDSVTRAGQVLRDQGWRKAFTLNEMLRAWASLVRDVESGYDALVDEYTNDLSCRDWLELAWPLLTERIRSARQEELEAIDHRFRAATTDDAGAALSRFYRIDRKDGWWWRRVPTLRLGEFSRDLDG